MKRLLQIIETMSGALFAFWQRLQGRSIGRRTRTLGRWPRVQGRGRVTIGKTTKFFGIAGRVTLDVRPGGTLTIGDRCVLNDGVNITVGRSVSIGDRALIARNVQIMDSSSHETDEGSGVRILPILIGRNVWIGTGAIVLPGVVIGDHSVVGAGAVVTKSIPPRVLAVGNPCKVVRTLIVSDEYVRR